MPKDGRRSKPFSGKQKRIQLQEKRQRKAQQDNASKPVPVPLPVPVSQKYSRMIGAILTDTWLASDWQTRETTAKTSPYQMPQYVEPVVPKPATALEMNFCFFEEAQALDIPTRPPWTSTLSKEELERQERQYFADWLRRVYSEAPGEQLGYFEHNLEVWRQLWRVCEISDIIVVPVDVRHPVFHFPPSLYTHVVDRLQRQMIVALTKSDLVEKPLLAAWVSLFRSRFPHLEICPVSIFADEGELGDEKQNQEQKQKKKKKRYVRAQGVVALLEACKALDPLSEEWDAVISECCKRTEGSAYIESDEESVCDACNESTHDDTCNESTGDDNQSRDKYVTIGFIGHPNVGKSSLINSIVGKKVVSTSKTPGHTKHFQTIHLSPQIRLCDCPGLIFPIKMSKQLQILTGLYNIAQVSDPYGPLLALAQLIDLPDVLGLVLPSDQPAWSVMLICQEFATSRGFLTSRTARPDTYRAANLILRLVADGRILLAWRPPGYSPPPSKGERQSPSNPPRRFGISSQSEPTESEAENPETGAISRVGGSFSALLLDD